MSRASDPGGRDDGDKIPPRSDATTAVRPAAGAPFRFPPPEVPVPVPVMTVPREAPASVALAAVRASGLRKTYGRGETAVHALAGVDVSFARGEFTAIMGPSGSGKSTLMHCLAGLDTATAGQVWLGDTELTSLRDDQLTTLRRQRIGFVFQSFNLLPVLDALENITLPLQLAGRRPDRVWLDDVIAGWACGTGWATGRTSSPGASSSGWRSPGRCSPGRTSSSP